MQIKRKERTYQIIIAILTILLLLETVCLFQRRKEDAPVNGNESENEIVVDAYISEHFKEALQDGSIQVWYQPIIDPKTDEIVSGEALSRWKDKEEYISPSVFVSELEASGQIVELDKNVFLNACSFQKKQIEKGRDLFPIAVNLSVLSLMKEDIVEEYAAYYKECGLEQGFVNIEVTESLDTDKKILIDVVNGFREAGFHVEIDDFGAGYASYENLSVVPYDVIKFDKSLIDQIENEKGKRILSDLIAMAKDFGMTTIAEGVETQVQMELLKEMEIDGIQGYYYSRPLPQNEFESFIESR